MRRDKRLTQAFHRHLRGLEEVVTQYRTLQLRGVPGADTGMNDALDAWLSLHDLIVTHEMDRSLI